MTRNLTQSRSGGADTVDVPGYAVEIKRQKQWQSAWWNQTCEQAHLAGALPALAYRLDRKPWRVIVPICALHSGFAAQPWNLDYTVELSLNGFAAIVREGESDA